MLGNKYLDEYANTEKNNSTENVSPLFKLLLFDNYYRLFTKKLTRMNRHLIRDRISETLSFRLVRNLLATV